MILFIQFLLLLFLVAILAYEILLGIELIRLSRGDVPYVPSTDEVIHAVMNANVLPKDGMILDLGCGDGKALRLFAAAGYQGPLVGYERAPFPWLLGVIRSIRVRSRVRLHLQDTKHAPLGDAKGVYLFLMDKPLAELAPLLEAHLPPGIPVVSAEFPVPGWTPEQVLTAKGVTERQAKIYVYRTGVLRSSAL